MESKSFRLRIDQGQIHLGAKSLSIGAHLDQVWRRPRRLRNKDIRHDKPGKLWPSVRKQRPMSGTIFFGRSRRSNRSQLGRPRIDTVPNNPDRRRDTTAKFIRSFGIETMNNKSNPIK